MQNLTVATNHKPLLKVFGDRRLCEMENPCLTNLKEKAMYFRFDMVYVPGRFYKGPDAMSRIPKDKQESEHRELSMIMEGISTKELRMGFLKQLWAPVDGREQGDHIEYQARMILEEELRGLEGEAQGCHVWLQCLQGRG